MKKQLAICAGLLLLGFGTARLAAAQAIYPSPGIPDSALPPYKIMSIVRSTGLAPLTRPMRRGPYYVLVAVDRVGRQMRVVIDAQLGDIVNLRPALAAGPYGPPAGSFGPAAGSYGPEAARSYGPEPGRPSYDPEPGRPYGPPGGPSAPPDTAGGPYSSHPSAETVAPSLPRSIPNARAMNAPSAAAPAPISPPPSSPTRVAVAEPALPPAPPLPRPRPKLASNETPTAPPAVAARAAPAAEPAAASPSAPGAPSPPSPAPNGTAEPGKQIE